MSVLLRDWTPLLPLAAAVAVAEEVGDAAQIKWPNDVLVGGRKVAGILVEGRPQERWMVLGIGLNVALRPPDLPPELRRTAGLLGRETSEIEPTLSRLLAGLERWTAAGGDAIVEACRRRDALAGRHVSWGAGSGVATGIDSAGRLIVQTSTGEAVLGAGEVHLLR